MDLTSYLAPLWRRRWLLLALLFLVALASGYLYRKSTRSLGYQACTTLYVADVSAPSMIGAAGTNLSTTAQLLAGETAANFFADDILDVAQSRSVAHYVADRLAPRGLSHASFSDVNGTVSGSRLDRTVNLCVSNPDPQTALAEAGTLGSALSSGRARFVGQRMANRTYVRVISEPTVGAVSSSRDRLNLLLRLILGGLLAVGVCWLWDALDPTVRGAQDLTAATNRPVLGTLR